MKLNSLKDILKHWVHEKPYDIAFSYFGLGEHLEDEITYKNLYLNSSKIANVILDNYNNDEVLLLLFHSPFDFIQAFIGCNIAGRISVPMFPPRSNQKIDRLVHVCSDSKSKTIITTRKINEILLQKSILKNYKIILLEDALLYNNNNETNIKIRNTDVSFLQYTSGSTNMPKGVTISNENILNNEEAIKQAFGHDEKTVFTGWLPFYHDMGLVGNILQPFYLGVPCNLMRPEGFLQKPIRWLNLISTTKSTSSGAPNFAYDICFKRIKDTEIQNLDLSSWKVAFNGAEPINNDTLINFVKKFEKSGFKKTSFYPCYGMAETTLLFTGEYHDKEWKTLKIDKSKLGVGDLIRIVKNNFKEIVSCGFTWNSNYLKIVDSNSETELRDGEIGEIWVKGSSVSSGYWGNSDLNHKSFKYLKDSIKNSDKYFCTGDVGFVYSGNLYLTGRIKDIIIINGKNLYCQDIEWFVESLNDSFNEHGTVCFDFEVNDITKGIVLIIEIKRTYIQSFEEEEIKLEVIAEVSREFGIKIMDLLFVKPFSIPKTSSNKLKRHTSKKMYVEGNFISVEEFLFKKIKKYA